MRMMNERGQGKISLDKSLKDDQTVDRAQEIEALKTLIQSRAVLYLDKIQSESILIY